jgi:predicted nucleic acid-binding protein
LAAAGYIVTGDNDLLVLKEFRGIKIVTVQEYLSNNMEKWG